MSEPQRGDVWWAAMSDKSFLADRLTQLSPPRMAEVCAALKTAVSC